MDKKYGTRLAVDIGGTFTDVALECGDKQFTIKTLTTKSQPEAGVLAGSRQCSNTSKDQPQPGGDNHLWDDASDEPTDRTPWSTCCARHHPWISRRC